MTSGRIEVDGQRFGLSWSVSAAAKRRGEATGDGYLIARTEGRMLIAVVDGSGSGDGAARAAQECLEELTASLCLALAEVFQACHRRLRGTRGAALALAEIAFSDPILLTWASVGDVDGQLMRAAAPGRKKQIGLVQSRGTLGFTYDPVHPQSHPLAVGDMILMTTDGISRKYRDQGIAPQSPADLTRSTLARFGRDEDDKLALALAVVAAP